MEEVFSRLQNLLCWELIENDVFRIGKANMLEREVKVLVFMLLLSSAATVDSGALGSQILVHLQALLHLSLLSAYKEVTHRNQEDEKSKRWMKWKEGSTLKVFELAVESVVQLLVLPLHLVLALLGPQPEGLGPDVNDYSGGGGAAHHVGGLADEVERLLQLLHLRGGGRTGACVAGACHGE